MRSTEHSEQSLHAILMLCVLHNYKYIKKLKANLDSLVNSFGSKVSVSVRHTVIVCWCIERTCGIWLFFCNENLFFSSTIGCVIGLTKVKQRHLLAGCGDSIVYAQQPVEAE